MLLFAKTQEGTHTHTYFTCRYLQYLHLHLTGDDIHGAIDACCAGGVDDADAGGGGRGGCGSIKIKHQLSAQR